MNKVVLIGRLTKDPELKFGAGTGVAVTNFTLAVDRSYVGADGQKQADFINIVCFRKLAEHVANNLGKGRLVGVSGSIQTRKYQAQDGTNRYATDIVADEVKFLDWPKDSTSGHRETRASNDSDYNAADNTFSPIDGEDDIPF